ncbi:MAG: DMT family transporter [bacterium]|jgi:drug/metabolite transporter (DMT)-like permease
MSTILKVHLSLFLVSLIYAATFTIAKMVMPAYVEPMGLIGIRVWGAIVLLWITHAIFVKEKITDKKDFLELIKCAVFGVAANMLLFFKGLSITTPINGAILMVTTPLFVGFFSFFILKEKVTILKVSGLILGVLGAGMLLIGPKLNFSSETLAGDIMVTLNAIIYSYYLIIAKPLLHKYNPITVIKWTFLFGGILILPFSIPELNNVQWEQIPSNIWTSIFFLIAGATFLTYLLNGWALRHANSSLVGAYIYLQPILASVIAILLGKDQLTTHKVIFGLMIFVGVYLVSVPSALPLSRFKK